MTASSGKRGRPPVLVDTGDPRYMRIVESREHREAVEASARAQIDEARRAEWSQAVTAVGEGLPVKAAAHAMAIDPATASRGLRQARLTGSVGSPR